IGEAGAGGGEHLPHVVEDLPHLPRRIARADHLAGIVDPDQPGDEQQIAEPHRVAIMADRRRQAGDRELLALGDAGHSTRLSPRSPRQASSGLPCALATALPSQAATTAANSAVVGALPETIFQPRISAGWLAFASASVQAATANRMQNAMRRIFP